MCCEILSREFSFKKSSDDAEAINTLHCRKKYSVFRIVGTHVGISVVDLDPHKLKGRIRIRINVIS